MKFQLTESQKKQINKINTLEKYIKNVERSIKQLKEALGNEDDFKNNNSPDTWGDDDFDEKDWDHFSKKGLEHLLRDCIQKDPKGFDPMSAGNYFVTEYLANIFEDSDSGPIGTPVCSSKAFKTREEAVNYLHQLAKRFGVEVRGDEVEVKTADNSRWGCGEYALFTIETKDSRLEQTTSYSGYYEGSILKQQSNAEDEWDAELRDYYSPKDDDFDNYI